MHKNLTSSDPYSLDSEELAQFWFVFEHFMLHGEKLKHFIATSELWIRNHLNTIHSVSDTSLLKFSFILLHVA